MLAAVVIMLSPLETGTTRGRRRERGRNRETGPSRGYLAPAGGARRAAKTRQLASRRGGAGRGPSISYMEGPCLIPPGRNVMPGPAPGNHGNAGRDDLGSGRARTRFPGGRAGPGAVSASAAASATGRCGTAGVRARKTGCRAVASTDALRGPAPQHRPLPAGDQLLNPSHRRGLAPPAPARDRDGTGRGPAPAAAEAAQLERNEDAQPAGSR